MSLIPYLSLGFFFFFCLIHDRGDESLLAPISHSLDFYFCLSRERRGSRESLLTPISDSLYFFV